jgi:hypothetical protein
MSCSFFVCVSLRKIHITIPYSTGLFLKIYILEMIHFLEHNVKFTIRVRLENQVFLLNVFILSVIAPYVRKVAIVSYQIIPTLSS